MRTARAAESASAESRPEQVPPFCLPKSGAPSRPVAPNRFPVAAIAGCGPRSRRGLLSRPGPAGSDRVPPCKMRRSAVERRADRRRARRMLYRRTRTALRRPCDCQRLQHTGPPRGLARRLSDPRSKAGISVCSLSSIRSRCRERPRHCRAAARRRPGHPRDPPLSERAGAAERLAAVGHPPALARDAPIASTRSTAPGSTASASTPGAATTRCSASAANLLQNPYHYRDSRTDGVMEAVCKRVPADEIYGDHRHPVPAVQHAVSALRRVPARRPKLIDAASRSLTIPDLLNYWLTGTLVAEYTNATTTQFVDARTRSWATDLLVAARHSRRGCCRRSSKPGPCSAGCSADVCAALAGHAGRGARLPRHRIGGGVDCRRAAAARS